ncbi:MAG: MurR/RpiR family transcriptional regulator, partial [Mycobacteriaceae bacterium]
MIRVRDILLSHLQAMSPAERKVARALLDGYPQAGLRSTHVLAEQAGTSAPTVLRMVARIGLGSYTELQAHLREEIVHELNSPVRRAAAAAEAPPVEGFGASVRSRTELIERTAKAVDDVAFQAAVDLLAGGPTSVLISGGYYSRFIAEILARQLDQVIPNVEFLADPLGYDIGKLHAAGRRSVVVTFDFRRYQEAPLQIAGLTRAAKASLIVIT